MASECRVCKKALGDGVGRYNDHILYVEKGIDQPICSACAQNNPDEHHRAFKSVSDTIVKGARAATLPVRRWGEVCISMSDLEAICKGCKESDCHGHDEFCDEYRRNLLKKYPLGSPIQHDGREYLPIMGGAIPKRLFDHYSGQVVDRLKSIERVHIEQTKRLLWNVEDLEEERRELHVALLAAAGFTPFDVSPEAKAFKVIIEEAVTERCRRLGVIP